MNERNFGPVIAVMRVWPTIPLATAQLRRGPATLQAT